jgi:cytochrome c biogenesis protein CcmG/thiol:disulfide interchange protein DsbE
MIRSVVCATTLAALLMLPGCGQSSDAEAAAKGDLKAAPDFSLEDAGGNKVTLSDLKGQVVLLNFWATWCGPCKIEMPWFIDFQRKYKDQGFTVVAVSLDEEGWDVVRPYAEEMQLNFPVVVGSEELATKFGEMPALPTTFIINKQGEIVDSHMGLVDRSVYEEQIESLL